MNLSHLSALPGFALLFKWTCLLTLGWMVHGRLRHRHARWRLILWRSLLCFSLLLPLFSLWPVPGLKIPLAGAGTDPVELTVPPAPVASAGPSSPPVAVTAGTPTPAVSTPAVRPAIQFSGPVPVAARPISWARLLLAVWAVGCALGVLRLLGLQGQLSRLCGEACPPPPELAELAGQIQRRLEVRREVAVQVSEGVTSPFVCGLWRPVILLPRQLLTQLGPGEAAALLSHEIAHLRGHDLAWCLAWRWMQAVCWFHPLVWRIPAVHNLACEQEADRAASAQLADPAAYAKLLARLALRVLALPTVETALTVNGGSQIARRLRHLAQAGLGAWNGRQTAAAFSLAALLFLMTAGCEFTSSKPESAKTGPMAFKEVSVVVQDTDGQPIEGATVLPTGFRVKGAHAADAYGWRTNLFGPPVAAVTDREGEARVKYPVEGIPEEKEVTGVLTFRVSHPEYATLYSQEYSVDRREQPVRMTRGLHLAVSGYFGDEHQAVTDLVANLSRDYLRPEEWLKATNGGLAFHKLSPGGHLLQLMGRLPSGEIVYSECLAFYIEPPAATNSSAWRLLNFPEGTDLSGGYGVHATNDLGAGPTNGFEFIVGAGHELKVALNMKSGVRLEGRLDDQVPRPVTNGRVLISVRPKELPAGLIPEDMGDLYDKYGEFHGWHSYRPIAADGSFVFEAIPPGEVDVVVHGDGFVSKSIGQIQNRIVDARTHTNTLVAGPSIGIPQPFALTNPVTRIEVVTEASATLELTAKTKGGKPIAGAAVYLNPNVIRMGNGIFGLMSDSSEAPFRTIPSLPKLSYSATTDTNGVAIVRNVPAFTRFIDVMHPQYQVPLQERMRDRTIRTKFSPGTTNHFVLTMEPKGTDYIGKD